MRDHKIGSIFSYNSSDLYVNNRETKGEESPEKSVHKTIPKVCQKQSQTLNF